MPNQNTKTQTKAPAPKTAPTTTNQTSKAHHPARTIFASIFGLLAVTLILFSIVAVWLNRTLTDTNTYVAVVAPLATKPEIQNFIAQKASEELVKNAPTEDLANALLPNNPQLAGLATEKLKLTLQPIVEKNIRQVIASPAFATLWKNTNQTAHAELISQLSSNSDQLSLDLHPLITDVIAQLKTTQLGDVSNQIEISPDAGKVSLKNSGIDKARASYKRFQQATIGIVVVALLCLVLSIVISVNHAKTIRRILMGTGIGALLLAAFIQVPSFIAIKTVDVVTQKAVVVIVQSTFHNLQLASLIIGVVCVAAALGSKLYQKMSAKKA